MCVCLCVCQRACVSVFLSSVNLRLQKCSDAVLSCPFPVHHVYQLNTPQGKLDNIVEFLLAVPFRIDNTPALRSTLGHDYRVLPPSTVEASDETDHEWHVCSCTDCQPAVWILGSQLSVTCHSFLLSLRSCSKTQAQRSSVVLRSCLSSARLLCPSF